MTQSSLDTLTCQTLPSLLKAQAEQSTQAIAQYTKETASGEWISYSWGEYYQQVQQLQFQLINLGLRPGQKVGILAPSSRIWDLVNVAVLAARGILVGMDPTDSDEKINCIARQCTFSAIVVDDRGNLDRFSKDSMQLVEFIVFLRRCECKQGEYTLPELLTSDAGSKPSELAEALPEDPATIIFTSGTTGQPKGIEYTHRQICTAVSSIRKAFPDINSEYRLACWLPLSNMFQRIINFLGMSCGAQTWYVSSPQVLLQEIREIEPHLFIGVPRFYEKLNQGICEKLESNRWQRRLAVWALRSGQNYQYEVRSGSVPGSMVSFKFRIADWLVLSRIRQVMGSNLKYMISGSAPMSKWLLENFHALGLLVLEAYGLSENVIPNAINTPGNFRFGTVGRALTGCELKQAQDGELLVRGPGVISHYLGSDQNLLDRDGFLATGDFGSVDAEGYVTLLGRKSEIIKTSTGRRIAPAPVEAVLARCPEIEYAVVTGEKQQFLTAIIVLKASTTGPLHDLAEQSCNRLTELAQILPTHSRPAGLVITTRAFSVEGGELTDNLKLRRKVIHKRYVRELESLYLLVNSSTDSSEPRLVNFDDDTMLCKI